LRRDRLRARARRGRDARRRVLLGDRQPDQGRRRAGGAVDEHHPRPRREADARGRRRLPVSAAVLRPLVVKLGGEVIASAGLAAIAADLAAIAAAGTPIVVVHGGGPQATRLQERLGIAPRQIAGRRVTDEATLDVMKMVVAGKLNVDLCAALVKAGARPVGLHGASSRVIEAEKRPPRVYAGAGP